MAIKKVSSTSEMSYGQTYLMDLEAISPIKGLNLRRDFNMAEIDEMVTAIKEEGGTLKFPPIVLADKPGNHPFDGHRRKIAFNKAKESGVPIKAVLVTLAPKMNEAESILFQLNRNNGKPFTKLEKSIGFKRLEKCGWTQAEIAASSGCTQAAVSEGLTIASLPEEIIEAIASERIGASLVAQLYRDSGNQLDLLESCLRDAMEKEPVGKITLSTFEELYNKPESTGDTKGTKAGKQIANNIKKKKARKNAKSGGDTKSEGGDTKSEGGDTKSEGGDTKSEGGDTKSEGGDTKSEGGDDKIGKVPVDFELWTSIVNGIKAVESGLRHAKSIEDNRITGAKLTLETLIKAMRETPLP